MATGDSIGKRIRYCRKKLRLTQEQVAKRLNLVKQAVSHWETGRHMPSNSELAPLAKVLETTTDYLLTGVRQVPGEPPCNIQRVELNVVPYASRDELLAIARGDLKPEQIEDRLLSTIPNTKDIIALDGLDAAMEPRFPANATLYLRYGQEPRPGEIGLWALLRSNELLLRRYQIGPSGRAGQLPFLLKPDNPDFGTHRKIEETDQPVNLGTLTGVTILLSR
jgi:transcriptional regulator with XRE-family HTH domain